MAIEKAAELDVLYAATAQGFFGREGLEVMRKKAADLRRMMGLGQDERAQGDRNFSGGGEHGR